MPSRLSLDRRKTCGFPSGVAGCTLWVLCNALPPHQQLARRKPSTLSGVSRSKTMKPRSAIDCSRASTTSAGGVGASRSKPFTAAPRGCSSRSLAPYASMVAIRCGSIGGTLCITCFNMAHCNCQVQPPYFPQIRMPPDPESPTLRRNAKFLRWRRYPDFCPGPFARSQHAGVH